MQNFIIISNKTIIYFDRLNRIKFSIKICLYKILLYYGV